MKMRLLRLGLTACLLAQGASATGQDSPPTIAEPNETEPLMFGAALDRARVRPGDKVTLNLYLRIRQGWHTYAKVPPDEPYVKTRWLLTIDKGASAVDEWVTPLPVPDKRNARLMLYESQANPLHVSRVIQVDRAAAGEIKLLTGMLYQVCNARRCLPPTRRIVELKLTVSGARKQRDEGQK